MIKSYFSKIFAAIVRRRTNRWAKNPIAIQQKIFEQLIAQAKDTASGRDHHFDEIKSYDDFVARVPIRDCEALHPYIERVMEGKPNVPQKGRLFYLTKASGTTSRARYIPVTKASIPFHVQVARGAILCYIHETRKAAFAEEKMIFLQGSPILDKRNGVKTGRLSGVVAHYVPAYLRRNRMLSYKANYIEDWETKVEAIVTGTFLESMILVSGIPS